MELEKSHEQVKGCDEISILSAEIYNNKSAATVRAKAIYLGVLSICFYLGWSRGLAVFYKSEPI